MANDNVQHGIDDNPSGDAEKGAVGGAVGGAVVGALAGGPIGAVVGAVAGGIASGVGVAAVDRVDNDNTVSGLGDGVTTDAERSLTGTTTPMSNASHHVGNAVDNAANAGGHNIVTGEQAVTDDGKSGLGTGAIVGGVVGAAVGGPVGAVIGGSLGSVAGGVAGDANEAAKTDTPVGAGYNDVTPGNNIPGVQTGGSTTAGTDTRGITEKTADVLTGDRTDDKTGGRVL